ncbi:MAG: hypothetical protein ING75_17065 [Rhodocyclaceae bacterium]|nr:hypothetical protein [Rhodocyclaceae bacterium]
MAKDQKKDAVEVVLLSDCVAGKHGEILVVSVAVAESLKANGFADDSDGAVEYAKSLASEPAQA